MSRSQKKITKKLEKRNLIFFCIACIVISTLFTFNLSTSRYMGQIVSEDDVLAVPIITLNSDNTQTYSITNMIPGETKEYTFSVSNVDGEQKNEVLLTYYFKIDMQTQIPLQVSIYDITDGTEQPLSISNNVTEQVEMKVVEQETDEITRNYKLKITWDKNDNSYTYAGVNVACNITLEAVQVTN